ncbi:15358_t:CDS:2, partial [Acaulospora morrowiae]
VRSEHLRHENGLKKYWEGVEQECKMRWNHKAEIELVLRNLSGFNKQLWIKEANLSELISKWYKSNISLNHSNMEDFVEDDNNNSSSDFGSNCNDVGNFVKGFGDDLGGNLDKGSVDENTFDTLSRVVGIQNSQRKINRKRRDTLLLS